MSRPGTLSLTQLGDAVAGLADQPRVAGDPDAAVIPGDRATATPTPETGGEATPLLYTPAQAAQLLSVPEAWLRRKAGRRLIPSTKLGKHLRFSRADLARIAADCEQTVRPLGHALRRS